MFYSKPGRFSEEQRRNVPLISPAMSKLIAVCGATGQLGGSVAHRILKEGWKVRAITRNVNGQAAQALKSQDAEVVSASYDDEISLVKAFEVGFYPYLGLNRIVADLFRPGCNCSLRSDEFLGPSPHARTGRCRSEGVQQMLTIASAAQKTSSPEHFIIHSLPSGEKLAGKEYICPHRDWKDRAADTIKESMSDLAQKTTFLWVAWSPSNMWTMEALKPVEIVGSPRG